MAINEVTLDRPKVLSDFSVIFLFLSMETLRVRLEVLL